MKAIKKINIKTFTGTEYFKNNIIQIKYDNYIKLVENYNKQNKLILCYLKGISCKHKKTIKNIYRDLKNMLYFTYSEEINDSDRFQLRGMFLEREYIKENINYFKGMLFKN